MILSTGINFPQIFGDDCLFLLLVRVCVLGLMRRPAYLSVNAGSIFGDKGGAQWNVWPRGLAI